MTVIKQMLEATTNAVKSQELNMTVPRITHTHAWAERADVRKPCHAQPPAHLNEQHAESETGGARICHFVVTESP